MVKEW